MAGVTIPGNSAYSVSKIAAHKYMEYVAAGKLSIIVAGFLTNSLTQ